MFCANTCVSKEQSVKELHLHYTSIMDRNKGARERKTMIDNDLQADSLLGFNKNVE